MAGGACAITRQTIHTFLRNYHTFASIAAFGVLPVSASLLLSQSLTDPSSSLSTRTIQQRFSSLFVAAGFPVDTRFFSVLHLKLSQLVFSFLITLPLTTTFLVLAKASIIHIFLVPRSTTTTTLVSSWRLYGSLLFTLVCNSFALLSANAAVFSLFFVVFNVADVLRLSSSVVLVLSALGAILYSIVLAHAVVICNLATVVSGVENRGGWIPLLKAFLLVRTRGAATALWLSLSANLGMAAVESLFQHRVVKPYRSSTAPYGLQPWVAWEALSIAYVHSILVVLDVLGSCMFFKSRVLRSASRSVRDDADPPSRDNAGYGAAGHTAASKCHEMP